MNRTLRQSQPCSTLTAETVRHLLALGIRTAKLLSGLPKRAALFARSDLVRQVDQRVRSTRCTPCPRSAESVTEQEIQRIAERLAEVFRAAPNASHPWLWGCFDGVVRKRLQMYEFVADWAIAVRE